MFSEVKNNKSDRVNTHIIIKILVPSSHFPIFTIQAQELIKRTGIIQKQNSGEAPWRIAETQSLTHEGEVEVRICRKHFLPH